MMCKVKTLLFGITPCEKCDSKYEKTKNEYENKYILSNQALSQISTQIYYVEHKIIKPIEAVFNIQSILLLYVERYKSI